MTGRHQPLKIENYENETNVINKDKTNRHVTEFILEQKKTFDKVEYFIAN
jgi:hypothetical protein